MVRLIDRSGEKHGRLTLVSYVGDRKWVTRCDCGTVKAIRVCGILSGQVRSCGCYQQETKFDRRGQLKSDPLDRFWSYVKKSDGCWEWTGHVMSPDRPYGYFSVGATQYRAHRWIFERLHGALPRDVYVCHRCDNPRCVRPNHLFSGTAKDNMQDCLRKGRHTSVPRKDRGLTTRRRRVVKS